MTEDSHHVLTRDRDGFSICFWFKMETKGLAITTLTFQSTYDDGVTVHNYWRLRVGPVADIFNFELLGWDEITLQSVGVDMNVTLGDWHLLCISCPSAAGAFACLDGGPLNNINPFFNFVMRESAFGQLKIDILSGGATASDTTFDEVLIGRELTDDDVQYLWNGGAARTWPEVSTFRGLTEYWTLDDAPGPCIGKVQEISADAFATPSMGGGTAVTAESGAGILGSGLRLINGSGSVQDIGIDTGNQAGIRCLRFK
jgi:hypothetical protein